MLRIAAAGLPRDELDIRPVTFDEIRKGCYDPAAPPRRHGHRRHRGLRLLAHMFVRFCGQRFTGSPGVVEGAARVATFTGTPQDVTLGCEALAAGGNLWRQIVSCSTARTALPPRRSGVAGGGLGHLPERGGVFADLTVAENLRLFALPGREEEAIARAVASSPALGQRLHQAAER